MIPSVLASQLVQGVKDFLITTYPSSTPTFFNIMDRFVEKEGNLFKGPYISVALPFKNGDNATRYFPDILPESFVPYFHQELAFKRLGGDNPQSTLVATGTGSGKTESFMFPILDYCFRTKHQRGIKAIIIYPMNALATDQAKRFAAAIAKTTALLGIRVGLFIGGDDGQSQTQMSPGNLITDKDILRKNPPDILLTNYKMLDFLLMRPRDQALWQYNLDNQILRYLAVDEIHSFDGAQGTDLASLVRRLRAKLNVQDKQLACIGTSATLGSEGTESIRQFATTVFKEVFSDDSVVCEYRISTEEFFATTENEYLNFPAPDEYAKLDSANYNQINEYLINQYTLWFPEDSDNSIDIEDFQFRINLGHKLKELSLFKLLLNTLNGKIISRNTIITVFQRRISSSKAHPQYFAALLDSLLALTSWAREEKIGDKLHPFLNVRIQLWLRELARMVGSLASQPEIAFSQDIPIHSDIRYYPIIHCRDCHAMGWGGFRKDMNNQIENDLDIFYSAFFSQDPRICFIFPIDKLVRHTFRPAKGRMYYVDPLSGNEEDEQNNSSRRLFIYQPESLTKKNKSHNNCPFCDSNNSLTILGSRAASLTSVLIGQTFASLYNDDKKLITFSDSVQDAAHRAGFFASRSYQFTVRTAIKQALSTHAEDIKLPALANLVRDYWLDKLEPSEYIATMIAPDMEWLSDYDNLQTTGKLASNSELFELVHMRLDWSVYSEFGHRSQIGRTLEHTNSAVAYIDLTDLNLDMLLSRLQNELNMFRGVSQDKLAEIVFGLLLHMKNIGAIDSTHLNNYRVRGDTYSINGLFPSKMYMPSFSSFASIPLFLTNKIKEFERIHNKGRTTWCDGWLFRNLMDTHCLEANYPESAYTIIFKALNEARIINQVGEDDNYTIGLNPEKLSVTTATARLACEHCKDSLVISKSQLSMAESMCCLRKGCQGVYSEVEVVNNYYRDLYQYGNLNRIVSKEHTGLLERERREWIENSFNNRQAHEAWKPNLLSATPTLEMGIDIGDLSSVFLCSVPPNGANYLQRIGRAGRNDGNAFNATIANSKDHDLYFYADPDAIMQGSIDAPGVFIDASAILQRQFMAYCIDNWVTTNKITEAQLPNKLSSVLDAVNRRNNEAVPNAVNSLHDEKFPYTLISYVQEHCAQLIETFFDLYDNDINEHTREQLRLFASGSVDTMANLNEPDELKESKSLAYKILNRLSQVNEERKSLAKNITSIRDKIKLMEKQEARDTDHDEILRSANIELHSYKSVLRELRKKQTFEFFTNEGLLPNYAFPESGVILKSIIYREKQ